MAIKTPQQYLESLKDGRVVYFDGERVPDVTQHPICKITNDWVAMDYVMNNDPRYQDLLTDLDEDGERVSFALQPQRTREDLLRLREMVKLWARVCFGKPSGAKFVAKDGLNAVTVVAPRVDKKYGTNYAANVEAYRKHLQKNDLAFAMGLTDIKGDRSLRPSQQVQHKDFYVRIVEERPDGIIVSGAKTHISQAPACNEVLIAPCRAMQEDDAAYAVAFGIHAQRARHHHDLRPAGDPRGRHPLRQPHLRRPSTSTTRRSSSTTSSSPTSASSSKGSGSSPARWPTCSPTSTA